MLLLSHVRNHDTVRAYIFARLTKSVIY